ncbi:motility associated factor glycosyltransferase family protein [Clostridium uliginosum]|uniref:Uncharacterized conserved protein n=1 Tax=Clostridium uliginosum TaxID=119641 RepID=A0A1I1HF66_9CLOT|nr:6-hydroxymethylpterin diphosphokinase MptE-like protein [Clostridium uliginosum]SFC22604.1 Uncharacterized conserved protein [Clostridium uliginosum]
MEEKVDKLLAELDDLKFDSLIFIFGIGEGEYIEELKKVTCERNKIFIIEPNKGIYKKYSKVIKDTNITLVHFTKNNSDEFERILSEEVHYRNFINLYVHDYNNYSKAYPSDYDAFINFVDDTYYRLAVFMSTSTEFKKISLENLISVINVLKESTPIDDYFMSNKGVPAIIVSAGPSLDKNIENLVKFKDKLNKFFIVAGNRTLKPLIENGIKPDLIVSIDPQEITYTMLKKYKDIDVPLMFCEQSNKKLVREYNGSKVYTTQGVLKNIEKLENIRTFFVGGSVAHSSVDTAILLGCNPIIFVGQDFAYTFGKHHSLNSSLDTDKNYNEKTAIETEDVFGNSILTDNLLLMYKKNMEFYIKSCLSEMNSKFINCSYGAKIEGTIHKELEDILKSNKFKIIKSSIGNKEPIKIDEKIVFKDIIEYIDSVLIKCEEAIISCETILQRKESFEKAVEMLGEILEIVDDFVKSPKNLYFKGYFETFLFDIKEKYFRMPAVKYNELSADIIYQSDVFKKYFSELRKMLIEVKNLYTKTIEEINTK